MGLSPISSSPLKGHARDRGRALTVTDSNGDVVVEAAVSEADDRFGVVFKAAGGSWCIQQAAPDRKPGRALAFVPYRSEVTVLDAANNQVAIARNGKVVLADGETLIWERRSLPARYRLGGDLWVAKGSWRSRWRFTAELSEAMLNREDNGLVAGIASILTQHAVARRRQSLGAFAGAGAGG